MYNKNNPMYCFLGDCLRKQCHHCFPVKKCKKHDMCIKHGVCDECVPDVLVTGCAGFIGSHTCEALLKKGLYIVGIDNLNSYYSVSIKHDNLTILNKYTNFLFLQEDIITTQCITDFKPKKIIHLAALAGVRYSLQHPTEYIDVNIKGFVNILEQAKSVKVESIVYASSSSVYGTNEKTPFDENDEIKSCNSPYAVSKLCSENYAFLYNKLFNMNLIGLRFFTVYGPRGRPDMAPYKFLKAIYNDEAITKYGDGLSMRDYTYIDDIVNGIIGALNMPIAPRCEIYNLGNSNPVSLNSFIQLCEKAVGKKAIITQLNDQIGDVTITFANITKAKNDLKYDPIVKLKDGLIRTFDYIKTI